MIETRKFSLGCHIRHWVYTVHVTKATGRVRKITAGCQKWLSFADAHQHYLTGKWYDGSEHIGKLSRLYFAHRLEATQILHKLQHTVEAYQLTCKRRRKRASR